MYMYHSQHSLLVAHTNKKKKKNIAYVSRLAWGKIHLHIVVVVTFCYNHEGKSILHEMFRKKKLVERDVLVDLYLEDLILKHCWAPKIQTSWLRWYFSYKIFVILWNVFVAKYIIYPYNKGLFSLLKTQ